jgi:hypothetical protein
MNGEFAGNALPTLDSFSQVRTQHPVSDMVR